MDREKISSSNENNKNYYNDINDIDPNQKNYLNLVQGRNSGKKIRDNTD